MKTLDEFFKGIEQIEQYGDPLLVVKDMHSNIMYNVHSLEIETDEDGKETIWIHVEEM